MEKFSKIYSNYSKKCQAFNISNLNFNIWFAIFDHNDWWRHMIKIVQKPFSSTFVTFYSRLCNLSGHCNVRPDFGLFWKFSSRLLPSSSDSSNILAFLIKILFNSCYIKDTVTIVKFSSNPVLLKFLANDVIITGSDQTPRIRVWTYWVVEYWIIWAENKIVRVSLNLFSVTFL